MPKPTLPEPLVPILCIVAPVTVMRVVLGVVGAGRAVIGGHHITIPALHWLVHLHILVVVHSLLSYITPL